MFIDPAGQYTFELPLGWAYNPARSHLITVIFARWERPDEALSVRAMPTFAPAEVSVEQWRTALEERCFSPHIRPLTPVRCGGTPAVIAEAHEVDPEAVHRRLMVVRGVRLDVLVEHRTPEPSTGPQFSEPVAAICRSLDVPTNRFLPALADQHTVMSELQLAYDSIQGQAWAKVIEPAMRAQSAARSTHLYSVVANTPLPEIPAIIALIDATICLAHAVPDLLVLRDAERLALRALFSLKHHPFVPPGRKAQMASYLTDQLHKITSLQLSLAQSEGESATSSSPGFGLAGLRATPLLKQAHQLTDTHENDLARRACEGAIADLLTVLIAPMPEPLPPQITQRLIDAGVTAPAEQRDYARQLVWRSCQETLESAIALLTMHRSLQDDVVGAADASDFICTFAQELDRGKTAIARQSPEELATRQASFLISHASNLAAIGDPPSLEDAQVKLDEAEKLLDTIGDEGALRAGLCQTRAFIMHSQRRTDGALDVIERGLRAAARSREAEATARELKALKSQFLMNSGRLEEGHALALELVKLPESDDARSRFRHGNYYLNLATTEIGLNKLEEAAHSLREALRRALEIAPFGEETFRILMVASRLYAVRASRLSERLNLAAAATLDARRATIASDKFRIGFDESSRHREVYEDLVGRLIAVGAGKEAVAAADRSRARSLAELLATSASGPEPSVHSQENPPSLENDNVEQSLWEGAEFIIRNSDAVLYRRGSISPLRADEIGRLAQEVGAPMLMIQPVRHQVALLLIQPSGDVQIRFSPLSLDEIESLVDTVQRQFYIYSVPRGGNSHDVETTSPGDDMNGALAKLWAAFIAPTNKFLPEAAPLVIVPYREFTLVPFGLLTDSENRPLVERHALSIVPSFATLRTLRQRSVWAKTRPARAYVAGDPAVDPRHMMTRLPSALAEAKAVAETLKAAGVSEEHVLLRLDEAAHEESYRREGRGCDLVHLSCHAQLEEPAYTSRLYFAPYSPYDGLLLASEVADVNLDDALVFLAACETGQGRATSDGVVGLGRAFLEAGARAIILSLWKVEDAATSVLSSYFYRALLDPQQPLNAVDALRTATLKTRADLEAGRILAADGIPLGPHPSNWAPFVILGDGLSIRYSL